MDARRLAEYDALLLTAAIWFLAKFLRPAFVMLAVSYDLGSAVAAGLWVTTD